MGLLCCFKKKNQNSDSSVISAAVIAESPSVIVVHEARTPQLKARGGSSHMGIDKAFDKRVRVTEEQNLEVLHREAGSANKQWVSLSRAILPILIQGYME